MSTGGHPDERAADALLSGRAVESEPLLSAFVADVRALVPSAAPAPTAELVAMLEHGIPAAERATPTRVLPRRTWWTWTAVTWTRVGLAGAMGCALVLSAAATNTLPAPAQTAVANVVEWVTPLHLPRPAKPVVTPTRTPEPTQSSEPRDVESSATPEPRESAHPGENPGHERSTTGDERSRPRPTDRETGGPSDDSTGAGPSSEGSTEHVGEGSDSRGSGD